MFRKLIHQIIVIQFFVTCFSYGYDYLYLNNPRGWGWYLGTIEEAVISVQPRGIYMECGLYLTFSARGNSLSSSDTLEVVFEFDLPENSIVHDSWLWIGEDIIQAKILDQWTASQLYEEIVNRRRDPSVLFKQYANHYLLRVYPMPGNETRKVKITYLVPAQWSASSVMASLPTSMLRTSYYPISTLYLLTWMGTEWKNPKLIEFPSIPFDTKTDPKFGEYLRADIPSDAVQSNLNFSCDAPFMDGVYLNRFQGTKSNIYQLAFLPSKALDLTSASRKVAILFDYTIQNSSTSGDEIVQNVRSLLHSYLVPADSFNIIYSRLNILRISDNWLAADSATIENVFTELGQNPMASYSNLPSLLANGVDFVKKNGNDGSLLLISNSDQVGDYQAANQLIEDLTELMDPVLPVHVGDFQNQNQSYHYIGGRYYYGNDYFYQNITRLTNGNYSTVQNGVSVSDMLSTLFESLGGFISSFDLHTSLNSGFCFGRYDFNLTSQSTYLNSPILQVGKYNGSFPFVIDAAGFYNSEVFMQTFEIQEADARTADSLSEEIWAGNYIQSLESGQQTNDMVGEIIDYSIDERILSLYTAFICLEEKMGGKILTNPWDESSLISGIVDDPSRIDSDSLFQAFPNPFNAQTVIQIRMKKSVDVKEVSFKICNVLGQAVKYFEPSSSGDTREFQFIWDGKNESGQAVSSGNYFFVMNMPGKKQTLKLLLLK